MLCCAVVALAPHCHVVLCCGGLVLLIVMSPCGGPGHFMKFPCGPGLGSCAVLCCAVCCVLHAVVDSLLCEVPPR